jgi:hypothetical protein
VIDSKLNYYLMLSRVRKTAPEHNAKETIAKSKAWFKSKPIWMKAVIVVLATPLALLLILLLVRGIVWGVRKAFHKHRHHRYHLHGKKRWYHHAHDHMTGSTSSELPPGVTTPPAGGVMAGATSGAPNTLSAT